MGEKRREAEEAKEPMDDYISAIPSGGKKENRKVG